MISICNLYNLLVNKNYVIYFKLSFFFNFHKRGKRVVCWLRSILGYLYLKWLIPSKIKSTCEQNKEVNFFDNVTATESSRAQVLQFFNQFFLEYFRVNIVFNPCNMFFFIFVSIKFLV